MALLSEEEEKGLRSGGRHEHGKSHASLTQVFLFRVYEIHELLYPTHIFLLLRIVGHLPYNSAETIYKWSLRQHDSNT